MNRCKEYGGNQGADPKRWPNPSQSRGFPQVAEKKPAKEDLLHNRSHHHRRKNAKPPVQTGPLGKLHGKGMFRGGSIGEGLDQPGGEAQQHQHHRPESESTKDPGRDFLERKIAWGKAQHFTHFGKRHTPGQGPRQSP